MSDTTASPLNSIGLLVREKQQPLSKCVLCYSSQTSSSVDMCLFARSQRTQLYCSELAQCTGTLIGAMRQHVLTAGHCLYDVGTGGLAADKISFYPSINGAVLPFAPVNAAKVRLHCDEHTCSVMCLCAATPLLPWSAT